METAESELEMVRRHVREGEEILVNQRALIARRSASGLSTDEAQKLLDLFESTQRQHEDHLTRLEGQQD